MLIQWLVGALVGLAAMCGFSFGRARGSSQTIDILLDERNHLRREIALTTGKPLPDPPAPRAKGIGVVETLRDRFTVKENHP